MGVNLIVHLSLWRWTAQHIMIPVLVLIAQPSSAVWLHTTHHLHNVHWSRGSQTFQVFPQQKTLFSTDEINISLVATYVLQNCRFHTAVNIYCILLLYIEFGSTEFTTLDSTVTQCDIQYLLCLLHYHNHCLKYSWSTLRFLIRLINFTVCIAIFTKEQFFHNNITLNGIRMIT